MSLVKLLGAVDGIISIKTHLKGAFVYCNFGDSLQLTNWFLDSGATCHMTPEVSDFIPSLLEDTYKHIEVVDGHHVTVKQKGQVRIKMCNKKGDPFIATLHNVLLAPDLCNRLF